MNFMNRLEKLRGSGRLLFLAILGAAAAPCPGSQGHIMPRSLPPPPPPPQAYLLVVGPPELRFAADSVRAEIAPTRFFPIETNLAKIEMPTEKSVVEPLKNFVIPTNAAPAAVVMISESSPSPASLPPIDFASSGTDPSIVTPEMLVDFLQPGAPGKNNGGPSVMLPINMGFTPPAMTAAPENSSRAVYKNE